MLPFLKIPVILAGDPEKGEEDKKVDARVIPTEISSYQPGYYWGSFIYMKGGHIFCTPLTADEIEGKLQEYWKNVTKTPTIQTLS